MNERDVAAVGQVLLKGVHPWTVRTRALNPVYQRTACPWCAGQFAQWAGHHKTCKGIRSIVRAAITAYEASLAERGIKPMPRKPTQKMLLVPVTQRPITNN